MAKTLWYKRGDGLDFACEEGSAAHKLMEADGGFELVDETQETESVESKVQSPKSKIQKPKAQPKSKAANKVKPSEVTQTPEQ